ncbi:MAG: hypothetical protein MJZ40_03655 [Bacteroidaceae bacterium]|nr:hypothetical protein [Bacteroidaceae bacterium]
MKKILILLLTALTAAGSLYAEDLVINVKTYWKKDGQKIPLAGVHVYRVTSAGRKTDYAQTYTNGDLWDGKRDERIRVNKIGFVKFECVVWDAARFNKQTGEFEFPGQQTQPDTKLATFTIDCDKVKGNEYTKEIELVPVDLQDFKYRTGEAKATAQLRVGGGFSPEADDGARIGDYETFGVRFCVPMDSLKPDHRIVAQPVWIDKKLNQTYYGDPLVYYGREYNLVEMRESAYHLTTNQRGLLFYDGAPRSKGDAYTKSEVSIDDKMAHYVVTHRDELHYPQIGSEKQSDKLFFRLPFFIKVEDSMANNDCMALVKWVITDYSKILSEHCDTVIEGRSDPLRFLRYDVGGFLEETNDVDANLYWFPERADGAHDAACDLKIFFETGQTQIDWTKGQNEAERIKAQKQIRDVLNIADADIREVTVEGFASPDGNPVINQKLAEGRVQSFRHYLDTELDRVSSYTRAHASIATWDQVADTLRQWNQYGGEIGDPATEEELRAHVDPEMLHKALDAVRVIKFNIKYEIKAAYSDEQLLNKYYDNTLTQEFMYSSVYRYLANAKGDWETAENICRYMYDQKTSRYSRELAELKELMAIQDDYTREDSATIKKRHNRISNLLSETHEVLLYANDLCAIQLRKGIADTTLLAMYLVAPDRSFRDVRRRVTVRGVPDMVLLNQAAAYLKNKKYGHARGLVNYYRTHRLHGQTESPSIRLIGDLIEANRRVTRDHVESLGTIDPINRVVCLLALKDATAEDLRLATELANNREVLSDTVPVYNVIRAMCCGRDYGRRNGSYKVTNMYDPELEEAAHGLNYALHEDPTLFDVCHSERDLKPIFKVMERIRRDEDLVKNIKLIRRNRAKEI